MEFFRHVDCPKLEPTILKQQLSIAQLPSLCASIDKVITDDGDHGAIYCLWGEFNIHRLELRHGMRFSLLNCPHALCWSITQPRDSNQLVVHCVIDDQQPDEEFVESINSFMDDWCNGLHHALVQTNNSPLLQQR